MMKVALAPGTTIATARRELAALFRAAGLETPELDARVLIGHTLGLDHTSLAVAPDRVIDAAALSCIAADASRRLDREPVARIVGIKEFWGLELMLSPATLVPRPETESVVARALRVVEADGVRTQALRIVDLGTGAGAILLALLTELPHARGVGTDISADALVVARTNAQRLGLIDRAAFVNCDYGRALAGGFDLVVSNPPYIARRDIAGLAPEVRAHDPRRALDGGEDGLDAYRAIAADCMRLLAPGGSLIVELGDPRAAAALLAQAGLRECDNIGRDLAGLPRVLCGRRTPTAGG